MEQQDLGNVTLGAVMKKKKYRYTPQSVFFKQDILVGFNSTSLKEYMHSYLTSANCISYGVYLCLNNIIDEYTSSNHEFVLIHIKVDGLYDPNRVDSSYDYSYSLCGCDSIDVVKETINEYDIDDSYKNFFMVVQKMDENAITNIHQEIMERLQLSSNREIPFNFKPRNFTIKLWVRSETREPVRDLQQRFNRLIPRSKIDKITSFLGGNEFLIMINDTRSMNKLKLFFPELTSDVYKIQYGMRIFKNILEASENE